MNRKLKNALGWSLIVGIALSVLASIAIPVLVVALAIKYLF